MGGRRSYSVKKVTGKGLGKFKKTLHTSIKEGNSKDIAINTTRIATENKKQQKEFTRTISLLRYVVRPKLKETASQKVIKQIQSLSKNYTSKPLSSEESKYLSSAMKRKRRHKK